MESIEQVCNCLNRLTPTEKRKADAVAGGSFQKILVELQILKNSFGKNTRSRHPKTTIKPTGQMIFSISFCCNKRLKRNLPGKFKPLK